MKPCRIMTYEGNVVNPLCLRAADINAYDIAHALSNVCRFCGHVYKFYSVAEHSVHVSRVCDPADALHGLLHDATEAYMTDLPSPIKHQRIMEGYRKAEARNLRTILRSFGLKPKLPPSVHEADKAMLAKEALMLKPRIAGWEPFGSVSEVIRPLPTIRCWEPETACEYFLNRLLELTCI